MACKYPALISAVVPFGAAGAGRRVRRRSAAAGRWPSALGWAVVMAPWLVKNVVDTGNPVYPLGYSVFGGRRLGRRRAKRSGSTPTARRPIIGRRSGSSLVDVAGRSDWQSPLYLALAPLAFLPPRLATVRAAVVRATRLPVRDLVAADAPARSVLAADAAGLAILAGLGADWTRPARVADPARADPRRWRSAHEPRRLHRRR